MVFSDFLLINSVFSPKMLSIKTYMETYKTSSIFPQVPESVCLKDRMIKCTKNKREHILFLAKEKSHQTTVCKKIMRGKKAVER